MKKFTCLFCSIVFYMLTYSISLSFPKAVFCFGENIPQATGNKTSFKPMIALVIDDFGGEDRHGVDEMLALKCPLTCAIMPALKFSVHDATLAHRFGHEVILHMPMESLGNLPWDWYGPIFIGNGDDPEIVNFKIKESLKTVPYAVGMNIHIGTGVSTNKKLISAILQTTREEKIYFLDSRTTINSVCNEVAKENNFSIFSRDIFLEIVGHKSYSLVTERIQEAVEIAKNQGYAIVIGHVGPVGGTTTVRGIADSLGYIQSQGVEIVPLSQISKAMMREVSQKPA